MRLYVLILCFCCIIFIKYYKYYEHFSNIYFPKTHEAIQVMTQDSYFKHFNSMDFKLRRLQNNNYKDIYRKSIQPFTNNEKNRITSHVNNIPLFKNTLWKFIKTKNIEGNMAHTQKDCIILPHHIVNKLMNGGNIMRTLVHEQVHVLQRQYIDKFNELYHLWGFRNINNIGNFTNNRTNPDGLDIFWVFELNNTNTLPIAIYRNDAQNITDVDIDDINISKIYHNGVKYIKKNKHLLKNNKPYQKFFGINYNYHPNEIAATYFEYYYLEIRNNEPQLIGVKGYRLFKKWLKNIHFV